MFLLKLFIFSVNITALDENEMAQALVGYQPVSIAFEVVSDFMHYKNGVYSSTDCKVRMGLRHLAAQDPWS